MDAEMARRRRADARRITASLYRGRLQKEERDLSPLCGPEALTLVTRLTREGWSLSGRSVATYSRDSLPYRFVPAKGVASRS